MEEIPPLCFGFEAPQEPPSHAYLDSQTVAVLRIQLPRTWGGQGPWAVGLGRPQDGAAGIREQRLDLPGPTSSHRRALNLGRQRGPGLQASTEGVWRAPKTSLSSCTALSQVSPDRRAHTAQLKVPADGPAHLV